MRLRPWPCWPSRRRRSGRSWAPSATTPNTAVLHTDVGLMPRRRAAWSAWNYVGESGGKGEVTYWMNLLQGLKGPEQYLVSLNPPEEPAPGTVIASERYEHPLFDVAAGLAQRRLWSLQGARNTWFCGAYFGSGFHEDGLQSGPRRGRGAGRRAAAVDRGERVRPHLHRPAPGGRRARRPHDRRRRPFGPLRRPGLAPPVQTARAQARLPHPHAAAGSGRADRPRPPAEALRPEPVRPDGLSRGRPSGRFGDGP